MLHVARMYSYVTRMYSCVLMLLVCIRMLLVSNSVLTKLFPEGPVIQCLMSLVKLINSSCGKTKEMFY